MKVTDEAVIVNQSFDVPISQLWDAITRPEEMKQWFFSEMEHFEAREGFKTNFIVRVEDRVFPHLWHITEVIPEKMIKYDWRYDGYPGASTVCFEIYPSNEQSELRLSATVDEDFPDDIPEFTRESCVQGWNYFIKQRLTEYLKDKA